MATFYDENKTLEFSFNEGQDVLQYDSSQFYREKIERQISGVCAVDFLCRDTQQSISYLIEVKNFGKVEGPASSEHRKGHIAEELATEIARKVFDTIAGVCIASRSEFCNDQEKQYAIDFLQNPMRIVFHYELPQRWDEARRKERLADMKAKLKNKLKIIDPHPRIEDKSTARYWQVREA